MATGPPLPSPPPRRRLPDRRAAVIAVVEYAGMVFHCTGGFFDDGDGLPGALGEVFIEAMAPVRVGSAAHQAARDDGILVSRLLQLGDRAQDIRASLDVDERTGAPASLVGTILDALTAERDRVRAAMVSFRQEARRPGGPTGNERDTARSGPGSASGNEEMGVGE